MSGYHTNQFSIASFIQNGTLLRHYEGGPIYATDVAYDLSWHKAVELKMQSAFKIEAPAYEHEPKMAKIDIKLLNQLWGEVKGRHSPDSLLNDRLDKGTSLDSFVKQ